MRNINTQTVRIDGGTQSRVQLDAATIADYAQAVRDGTELPPVVVFFDGTDSWLADGFHRLHAYRENKRASIPADIRTGTQRDAILHSLGANDGHGLRRTNEDKHKIVGVMLDDAEWSAWSNYSIAKTALVSEQFVRSLRLKRSEKDEPPTESAPDKPPAAREYTTKHGTKATMKTGGIGKKKRATTGGGSTPETDAVEGATEQSDRSDELAEAQHTVTALANEVEELKAMLAVEHMDASEDAKTEASQIIADLRAQVKTLEAENAALRTSRDKYQSEVHELMRQVKMNQRELDRARAA